MTPQLKIMRNSFKNRAKHDEFSNWEFPFPYFSSNPPSPRPFQMEDYTNVVDTPRSENSGSSRESDGRTCIPSPSSWLDPNFPFSSIGYTLYGIVMHNGPTLALGHYYAFVRSSGEAEIATHSPTSSKRSSPIIFSNQNPPMEFSEHSSPGCYPSALPAGAHPLDFVEPGVPTFDLHPYSMHPKTKFIRMYQSPVNDTQFQQRWLGFDDENSIELTWKQIVQHLSQRDDVAYGILLRRDGCHDIHVKQANPHVASAVQQDQIHSSIPAFASEIERTSRSILLND